MLFGKKSIALTDSSQRSSLALRSISYTTGWVKWGAKLVANAGYSPYRYARDFLHYKHNHAQKEAQKIKQVLSATERAVADGLSGAVKGTVAAAVIYSGASLPVVGLVSLGLLPKNTAMRLGGKVLGASFQVVLNAQDLAGYALSMMHWAIPTDWMQLGLKKGSDAVISFVDSKNLTRLYQDYHVGERIWLWTGTIASIRNDLRMIPQKYKKIKVTEYQNKEISEKVTDTLQCQKKWLFWDECRAIHREIIKKDLVSNRVITAILESNNDAESWVPVSYKCVSDEKSYQALYKNGRINNEVTVAHLPKPSGLLFYSKINTELLFPLVIFAFLKKIRSYDPMVRQKSITMYSEAAMFAILCQLKTAIAEDNPQHLTSPFGFRRSDHSPSISSPANAPKGQQSFTSTFSLRTSATPASNSLVSNGNPSSLIPPFNKKEEMALFLFNAVKSVAMVFATTPIIVLDLLVSSDNLGEANDGPIMQIIKALAPQGLTVEGSLILRHIELIRDAIKLAKSVKENSPETINEVKNLLSSPTDKFTQFSIFGSNNNVPRYNLDTSNIVTESFNAETSINPYFSEILNKKTSVPSKVNNNGPVPSAENVSPNPNSGSSFPDSNSRPWWDKTGYTDMHTGSRQTDNSATDSCNDARFSVDITVPSKK